MSSRDDVIVLSNFEELFNNELQKETIIDTRRIEAVSWKEVIPHLAPLLTSNQISVLLVSCEFYQEVVGRLKSELTNIFQRKYGESVVINGRSVPLNRFFNFSFVLNKVVPSSKKTVNENELQKFTNLKEILKDVNALHDSFPNVGEVLFHAAKSVQKRNRKYIEIQKKSSPFKNSDSENDEKCLEIVKKDGLNDDGTVDQSQSSLRTVLKRRKLKSVIKKLAKVTSEVNEELDEDGEEENGANYKQKCYICKTRYSPFSKSDEFSNRYTRLCYDCSKHNNEMRNMRSNLSGKYAIVTGARLKIGYATALKLLRDGCYVIATTRFPHDAAQRYSKESDYDVWCDRLKIYPIDLLDIASVYRFIEYVKRTLPYLDILVNNAAQTISRPLDFYKHLFELERSDPKLLDVKQQKLLVDGMHLSYPETPIGELKLTRKRRYEEGAVQDGGYIVTFPSEECCSSSNSDFSKDQALVSTEAKETNLSMKQEKTTELLHEGVLSPPKKPRNEIFPNNHLDQDGQQIDLREFNSWRYTLSDVPFKELTDVLTINTLAPFILTSQLRTLMCKSPSGNKFIVNVSAMEGQFHRRSKTCDHPHTNMAKAALNMLTRTSGLELVNDGIYMTAVDTGWVTDERPFQTAEYERMVNKFDVPLDCIDGAARVYHPIVHGLQPETQPYFAVFLKDYKPFPW